MFSCPSRWSGRSAGSPTTLARGCFYRCLRRDGFGAVSPVHEGPGRYPVRRTPCLTHLTLAAEPPKGTERARLTSTWPVCTWGLDKSWEGRRGVSGSHHAARDCRDLAGCQDLILQEAPGLWDHTAGSTLGLGSITSHCWTGGHTASGTSHQSRPPAISLNPYICGPTRGIVRAEAPSSESGVVHCGWHQTPGALSWQKRSGATKVR